MTNTDSESDNEDEIISPTVNDQNNLTREQDTFYTGIQEDLSYLKSQNLK